MNTASVYAQFDDSHIRAVDASAANCGDGTTWNTAYQFLQDALEEASEPGSPIDEIWVRAGEYYPDQDCANPGGSCLPSPCDRGASFELINGVKLYGGFDGTEVFLVDRDPETNLTILSGDIDQNDGPGQFENNDNNSFHVVTANGVGITTIIDGFTITAGNGDGNAPIPRGGGMLLIVGPPNFTSGPVIIRCTFIDNYALDGGGLSGSPGFGLVTTPLIIDCQFIQNIARDNGGGAHAVRSVLDFVNCLFAGNIAQQNDGGGLFAGVSGGGTISQVVNCTFSDNDAPNGQGGGMFTQDLGDPVIFATVINSTLWGNTHSGAGDETEQVFGPAVVTYSCVQDEAPGDGNPPFGESTNIDVDPMFVDAGNGDYRLMQTSPCIDLGNNDDVPCDQFDLDNDGFDCISDPPEGTPDLDLINRVLDGDDDDIAIVDMGSYEFIHPNVCPCADICPADFDGSCDVGVKDLLFLLGAWGPCADCNDCPPADFDDSCDVGVKDLLFLLGAWGTCPCGTGPPPPSLQEAVEDAGLDWPDDWDEFEEVMTNPESSQAEKDNYYCWMDHYLNHCTGPACPPPACPDDAPFGHHE